MFLKHLDLTTALRPLYLPDEVLLFVQDNVGLYEGKFKIPSHQNGSVYLTSHRICYIDTEDPRKNSVAIDLKEVERHEFYAGFMRSSAKITLFPKPSKRSSIQNRAISNLSQPSRSATASPSPRTDSPFHLPTSDPSPVGPGTWICPICSFSNPVPSNFDPYTASERTPLAPCLACGIKPPYALVMKAAIASATSRPAQPSPVPVRAPIPVRGRTDQPRSQPDTWHLSSSEGTDVQKSATASFQCPRCTFLNHPSLLSCELCGAPLISQDASRIAQPPVRTESPGPVLNTMPLPGMESNEIKISFRTGGEKIFLERLKGSMTQRKWLLQNAPPVPTVEERTIAGSGSSTPTGERVKTGGIAGLEQRSRELRKNNELVIGNAFEDLEALMASAKEIIALAESFAATNGTSGSSDSSAVANALGLVTTKDMLGGGSNSESLYISELSRNLAEFLTDDARGVLRKAGGIISLVDLWAVFNRARGGVELVSPLDFEKAARLWEKLKLPVRLRQFKSGVLVVQASDRTDEKTIKTLLAWLNDLHVFPPDKDLSWDWQVFGGGITAQDAAERFGWSIGVAEEELEMAEEKGALCREESIEGLKFWENWIDDTQAPGGRQLYNVI
ncbi:vacuolar protein sorting protein-like protein [Mollisia scopiformis]|uniref:Vacuolar protein-sorting-associated protein 36 n=1 Tax=Mollisia scopiformis TaxID=149040 RepID=A0A194X9Z3_MOLSC|nr:vacuolar protein sorting protein-like protein [Mollisia scopiformis]KUJ16592.1 vacuolar protein sorting protein-like protein [Mollisia scopiformis]